MPVLAAIQRWTPFLLVLGYGIISTCIYTICTRKLIQIFWFLCLFLNFYIAGNSFLESWVSLSPLRDARRAMLQLEQREWKFNTDDADLLCLDIVIVAYLPNEKDIVLDRLRYALDQIEYPKGKLTINLVYNTPHPIEPLEQELHQMAAERTHLRVIAVPSSKSKADNINHFLSLGLAVDVIAIFDCDHYPHPYGPRWAMERLTNDPTIDIVQGRCVVFNAATSFQTAMVAVEFDKIYAVSHPGRTTLWKFGLFTGSNGFWRASRLTELRLDASMLTEDIDSSMRALDRGMRIVHELNVVSYELAPVSLKALWNQRLRWAQGWAEASLRHAVLSWNYRGKHTGRARFGLLSLLFIRELSYYFVTQYVCLVLGVIIAHFPRTLHAWATLIYFQYPVSQWLFVISATCLLLTLLITYKSRSEFIAPWMILVFSAIYPVYLVATAVIGLYGHARLVSHYTAWNPTART